MTSKWADHSALVELWIGIGILLAAGELILVIVPQTGLSHCLGYLAGCLMAALMARHMERNISKALDLGEGGADKSMRAGFLIRYFSMAAFLILIVLTKALDVFAAFIGLMTLKLAAYMQPLTHMISVAVCGAEAFEREMVPAEVQDELYGKKKEED